MTEPRGAQIDPTPLVCLACRHQWIENLLAMVPLKVWAKHVRLLTCPVCHAGSNKLAIKTKT